MNFLTTTTFIALLTMGVTANSTNARRISTRAFHPQAVQIETKELTQQQVNILVDRVHEIRSMDLKSLNNVEKRELRKELVLINKQLTNPAAAGGIYISAGTLILIIILLIILF